MTFRDLLHTARLLAPALLVLALIAACGSDDDDDPTATTGSSGGTTEATSTSADATTTGTAADGMTTATAEDDPATGTADDGMTTATADDDDATGTADGDDATGTADDGTATGTAEDDATGTAEDDGSGTGTADSGSTDDPLAELGDVTALENYTLVAEGSFNFTAAGAQAFTMEVQRSAPDNYRFLVDILDLTTMEVWAVTDTMYIQMDGGTTEDVPFTPEDTTGQFNPSFYLTQFQQPELFSTAELVGDEEINGRATTHYTFTAEQWAEATTELGMMVEEVGGEGGDIWVDNELSVIVRMNTDLSWTDGTTGETFEQIMTWDVTDIDETEPVEPPSS